MSELYNLANIRELLTNGFNDAELRALCFDLPGFRPVYDQLAQNTGKAEIVAKLLEHADKTEQLDTLLALAKERNPARYEKHRPYHLDDTSSSPPTALTREQQYQIALDWVKRGRKDSLARFDLSDANLPIAYLNGADLREANLEGAVLTLANLAKTDLRMGKLQRVNLEEADLTEADLRKADLSGANLRGANLSKANLSKAVLGGADFGKANLSEADLSGVIRMQAVDLTHLSEIERETIVLPYIPPVRLTEAILSGADLHKAELGGADLIGADLSEAKLERVELDHAKLVGANLRKANLYWATLLSADLRGANLSEAHLKHAYLMGAELSQTDLSGANLSGACLSSADLDISYLLTRSESEANLQGDNLRRVQYDSQTKWPIGFDPTSAGAIRVD